MNGYSVRRQRVAWCRWDARLMRQVISHPVMAIVTEPDGNERCFATVAAANEWISSTTVADSATVRP